MARSIIKIKEQGKTQEKIKENAQVRVPIYADGDTLEPELPPDDDLDIDLLDLSEDDDDFQDGADGDSPAYLIPHGPHPLWLLYGGQILWASDDIRFNTKELEFFRRRLQHLLDFLLEEFHSYFDREHELLMALEGFFVRGRREKKKKKGKDDSKSQHEHDPQGWLSHLRSVAIVFEDGQRFPLSKFLAGQGENKEYEDRSTTLPNGLENLWLERELEAPLKELRQRRGWSFEQGKRPTAASLWREKISLSGRGEAPLPSLAECKEQMREGINGFCGKVNGCCAAFPSAEAEDKAQSNQKSFGLGFASRRFKYEDISFDNVIRDWKGLPAMQGFFKGYGEE